MTGSRSAPCDAFPRYTRVSVQLYIGLVNMSASIELYAKLSIDLEVYVV